MGVEETPLEELVRIKDSQVKEEVLLEEMVIREGGGGDDDPDPSDDGDGDDFSSSTDSSVQRKENRWDPNMFMCFKDLLVQRVNLTSRKRW